MLALSVAATEPAPLDRPHHVVAESVRLVDFALSSNDTVAVCSRGSGVSVMKLSTGDMVARLPSDPPSSEPLACGGAGLVAAAGPGRMSILLWKPPATEVLRTFTSRGERFAAVALSSDGHRLATAERNGTITLWNADTGELLHRLNGHISSISALSFSPDGGRLLSAGTDNDICIWDTRTGQLARRIEAATHTVFAVTWSADGQRIYSGGASCTVIAWNAKTGERVTESPFGPHVITSLAISPDGRTLAAGGFDPASSACPADIRFHDSVTLSEQRTLRAHSGSIAAVGFSSDGGSLFSASSAEPGIKVWSLK